MVVRAGGLGSTRRSPRSLGPLAEIAISATGAFDYANPDFAGIPMWLPALWANGGLLIRRLLGPVVLPQPGSLAVAQQHEPASAPT